MGSAQPPVWFAQLYVAAPPPVKTIGTNKQGEVLEAIEAILDETSKTRVLRIHMDRGGEWLNASFRQEVK